MNIVFTRLGSFITSDSEVEVREKLKNRKWKYNLETYMNKKLTDNETKELIFETFFVEKYTTDFVED